MGFGDSSLEALADTFRDICLIEVKDDGLRFDEITVETQEIKSLDEYVGTRVTLIAYLGSAKIPLQVDIGIGDAIVPPAEEVIYPVLLEHPAPRLRAYCMETEIAEKLYAMVIHGMQNTRMKDYFDIYYLSQHFAFTREPIRLAIESTFSRRGNQVPQDLPLGLTLTFADDTLKQTQWNAFLRKMVKDSTPLSLPDVVASIADFIKPILDSSSGESNWAPAGPWK